jgi:hypothetical protein
VAAKRPNPARWLYYQYGGNLPETYREWVLHDGTCRTWLLRAALRGLIQIAPLALALLLGLGLIGGSWPVAAGAVLLGVLVILRITLTNAVDSVDGRLIRYGYPPRHGSTIRGRATALEAERYKARWRQHSD